jgi:glycosyltransferase involved in cell wall biosynthesis
LKRVIVSVTNDLVTDQRVGKTCAVLTEMGFKVLLVGRKLKKSNSIQRDYEVKRFRLLFNKGFLFYAEYNLRLFFFLLFSKKNLLFSNDLDTLVPNYLISKIQKKKLIFDSHELFSEIPELENRKRVKNFWLAIEKKIIPKLKNIITVSDSIKEHYQSLYGVNVSVVRNIPENKKVIQTPFDFDTHGKKIILYQGSVNVGRGLELMIDTMHLLEDYILVIIGDGDISTKLIEKVNTLDLKNCVKFLGRINPDELKNLTPNTTVGMSLEEDLGLNYRYALPNKIFDYIHAEVPMVVSNLPEMKAIIKKYAIGEVLIDRTPISLASTIKTMAAKNYKKELIQAKKQLNWTLEKEKLISIISPLG